MKKRFRQKLGQKQIMHQHIDKSNQVCGQSHPEEAVHTKKSTIEAHERVLILKYKEE